MQRYHYLVHSTADHYYAVHPGNAFWYELALSQSTDDSSYWNTLFDYGYPLFL
jgi:hypothetical protein